LAWQFNSNWLDLYPDRKMEVSALWSIAVGFNGQGKFEEALPVLERCVTVKPDAADCYVGESFEGLGRLVEARKAYERAISIGG